MFNRFKLFLLLVLLAMLTILFVQNRQPLALKLFCPDINQSCWYRTSELPLALWMGLFIVAGAITSLIWQLLSSSSSKKNYVAPPSGYRDEVDTVTSNRYISTKPQFEEKTSLKNSDWESKSTNDNWNNPTETAIASEYEIRREPENVERSGSTYSYKFREASDRHQKDLPKSDSGNKNDHQSNQNSSNYTDNDDEDWI